MPYYIQNMRTGKFVEGYLPSRKLIETSDRAKAVKYSSFGHASEVVFWVLSHLEKWRIINCETLDSYVHDQTAWRIEIIERENDNGTSRKYNKIGLL